ncbi:sugar phosphate isomerase/epimerase [Rubripirellula amarantea]|uniref:Xylose isomerase-like TIM barrel n=1 Tax=Rubripirellula amarantea TaxID=2527999 RepID=A0A5C5WKU5_9BACT|nr:TIM barrel protein [Rubripirellula amarantea]MDA8743348.1 sugar phosphate isomerase/epimerase [Rubripirellula amarantea]TWT51358.1 Xylose isomerase-like TIM barrel [Rubripirellula amarantea]
MTFPILISGFADEAANEKLAVQQYSAFAAVGLRYYSIRFIDAGDGIKNVMGLSDAEIQHLVKMQADYGLSVSSIGSPIGKVKLLDIDDGTSNKYVPFDKYLAEDVSIACDRAEAFGSKLIRGFAFYHPKGTNPEDHVDQVSDQLSAIADACDKRGLTFGLEVEANLVGQTGQLLEQIAAKVNHPAMLTIFDGANIVTQGFTADETYGQYLAMKPSLGWVHIKDYHDPSPTGRISHVDEASLSNFVPADVGDSGHEAILRDMKDFLPELHARMTARGADGVFLDLEPHVKGGGQFGGFSGPDGFGVALRGLCNVLDYVGIDYSLRSFADIKSS